MPGISPSRDNSNIPTLSFGRTRFALGGECPLKTHRRAENWATIFAWRASALLSTSVSVLLLFWVTSRPGHAIMMSVEPPAVVGLFVNPANSDHVVVKLRLPDYFSYRPGEVIVVESTDGGMSFSESTKPDLDSTLVQQALDETAPLPRKVKSHGFSPLIDHALGLAYALDTKAFLQKHPALKPTRSAYWPPLFVLLGLLSVLVPVSVCGSSFVCRNFGALAAAVVLLLTTHVALTFVTVIRELAVDIHAPTSRFFGAALRCAAEPLPLAALFLPITLLLPSSRLAVTQNRWIPLLYRSAVTIAWSVVAVVFWLSVLGWSLSCGMFVL